MWSFTHLPQSLDGRFKGLKAIASGSVRRLTLERRCWEQAVPGEHPVSDSSCHSPAAAPAWLSPSQLQPTLLHHLQRHRALPGSGTGAP